MRTNMKRRVLGLLCLAALCAGCAAEPEYHLAEEVWELEDCVQRITYEYDDDWNCIARTFDDGSYYERMESEYNENGDLVKESVYDRTDCTRVREYVYDYDEAGRLMSACSYLVGEPYEDWKYVYDGDGNVQETTYLRRGPYEEHTTVETFDASGNLVRSLSRRVPEHANPSESVTDYTYDADGKLLESRTTVSASTGGATYRYNAAGRLQEIVYWTGKPEQMDARRVYTYDADMETEEYQEPSGRMISKVVRQYDSAENLIREEYYNTDGTIGQTVTYSYIQR